MVMCRGRLIQLQVADVKNAELLMVKSTAVKFMH